MKIGIDARLYGLKNAGLGRYTLELVNRLQSLDKENDYVLFLRRDNFDEVKILNPKFKKILADFAPYGFAEQLFFPFILYRQDCDLIHLIGINAPIFYFRKYIITVFDLIKHYSRGKETTTRYQWLYFLKYFGYLFISWCLVKFSAGIICMSYYVKKDIERLYPFSEGKIFVIGGGVNEFFQKPFVSSQQKIKFFLQIKKIKPPFVVYVGNIYPHKNLEKLIRAIKIINRRGFFLQLVIVCGRGVFYERLKKMTEEAKMEKKVSLIGFLSDKELKNLYHEARAYVFPSLMEGFGLPPLDAMACGLPVVSSNATCLPEIYGKAAHYFNPENVREMTEAIIKVLTDENLRQQLIKNGYERIKLYSWSKMAKETLKIYQKA